MHKFLTISVFALAFASAVPAFAQSTSAQPTCAAGDPVVWENSSSKVYHLQGDSYFGKTKQGQYACKSAADAAGYHVSGSKSPKTTSSPSAMGSPAPSASASPSSKHHHHSKSSPAPVASGAPSPSASASPSSKHHHHHSSKASPAPSPAAT